MKWLLPILGLSRKNKRANQQSNSEVSFLAVNIRSDQLICNWKIRDESKSMIQRDFESALFIRVKHISGDHSISSKIVEVSLYQEKANINLPLKRGKILVDLGYKSGIDFMTLEYQVLDLGPKTNPTTHDVNWFTKESENIHEEMY